MLSRGSKFLLDRQSPMPPPDRLNLITSEGFTDYALLDCGAGRKLERFGKIIVDRPEPQALWQPRLAKAEWAKANAVFSASGEDDEKGKWRIDKAVPDAWPVKLTLPSPRKDGAREPSVTMLCKLAGLWHLGLFPEQEPHWRWMVERLQTIKGETPRVLNLFGYTGAASLIAAKAGAEVTHVDASKKAIQWGKENQAASKLDCCQDPLADRRCGEVCGPRSAARQDLSHDPRRSSEVRSRAGGRGVGFVREPAGSARRSCPSFWRRKMQRWCLPSTRSAPPLSRSIS